MRARLLPAGDAALLVEINTDGTGDVRTPDRDLSFGAVRQSADSAPRATDVLALTAALRGATLPGVVDLVPAARTVLVLAEAGVDIAGLRAAVAEITAGTERASTDPVESDEVLVRVRYDGPDLDDVAALTGLSRAEVIGRHSGTRWRAAFIGFAPGFAYLVGDDGRLDVPRRAESRTRVPAGAVALAGGYSAVYPRESPGGWQLIGSTDTILWAVDREPPSLIRPGSRVRFVDAEHD